MPDRRSLPSFDPRSLATDPRFWASPFPSLSDCGKVNRGRILRETMGVAVSERWPPDPEIGGIGAAESGKAQLRR